MFNNSSLHFRDPNEDVPDRRKNVDRAFSIVALANPTKEEIAEFELLLLQHPFLIREQSHLPSFPDVVTTLLYTAARAGNLQLVTVLIDKGADPNFRVMNESGSCPMHVACYRGHVECVKKMLRSRHFEYDVSLTNEYGEDCCCVDPNLGDGVENEILDALAEGNRGGNGFGVAAALPRVQWDKSLLAFVAETEPLPPAEPPQGGTLHDSLCANYYVVDREGDMHTVVGYVCAWYFLGDDGMWGPLQPDVASQLTYALETPSDAPCRALIQGKRAVNGGKCLEEFTQEYLLDPHCLTSTNVDTGCIRPLLRIEADGLGVFGPNMPTQWAMMLTSPSEGGTAMVRREYEPLPLSTCKAINNELCSMTKANIGEKTIEIESSDLHNRAVIKVLKDRKGGKDLCIELSCDPEELSSDPEAPFAAKLAMNTQPTTFRGVTIVKFIPTVFHVIDGGLLEPLSPGDMKVLHLALVARHHFMRDAEFEYDLVQRTRTRIRNGEASKLVFVRPARAEADQYNFSDRPYFADIRTRLETLLQSQRSGTEEVPSPPPTHDNDGSSPSSCSTLRLMGILRNEFGCTLTGRSVADAVVLGKANVRRIDVELPRKVHVGKLSNWMNDVRTVLEEQRCVFSGSHKLRAALDPLTQEEIPDGEIRWALESPKVVLKIIPPWNTVQHPPRAIDFSINNLRIEPGWTGIGQSVPLGLKTLTIVSQLREKHAMPVYDVEWLPDGEGGCSCYVRTDISKKRWQTMTNAIQSVEGRGFTLIPLVGDEAT